MTSLSDPFVVSNPHRRRGAAMLITMLVTTTVVAVLFMASERTRAHSIMTDLGDDRLRASLAAESVAALVEAKLVSRAAEVETLATNVHEDPATWWNLVGCAYTVGDSPVLPERGLWVDGCVVRWRIEPVRIASAVDQSGVAGDATYTVNRETDPGRVEDRDRDARAGGGGTLLEGNPPYFHYRIVAEAYALKERDDATAVPWREAGDHTVSVQVQRVVQLNLVNLFDYAIFYGASGETGDLELEPETDATINASVHSNGAIYLGGAGSDFMNRNYKKAASDGGAITMGGRSDKVQISGVMGVYRLRKSANVYFASPAGDGEPTVKSPRDVPLPGKKVKKSNNKATFMSGTLDLNGGDGNPATEKVTLNGEKFTYQLDSRRDWSLPENRFDPYITDSKSGGTAITTLANIPHFSGHPLEAQRLVGEQIPLYRTSAGQHFTIDPTREPARLLYYTATGDLTTDPVDGVRPVYATDMPLFRILDGGRTYVDVWPNQPIAPTSAGLAPAATAPTVNAPVGATPPERWHTWLPDAPSPGMPGAMLGYYLEKSLFGEPEATTTGLTIRERGRQNPAFRFAPDGTEVVGAMGAMPPEPGDFADPAAHVRALVAWLKSNYAVYLGRDAAGRPQDITDAFFDFGAAAAAASGDVDKLVASQGRFVNRREAHWLQDNGYFSGGPAASARTLRARPFTLHLARACEFLRTPDPAFGGSAPNRYFNGLIYLHRTPRLGRVAGDPDVHEPLAPLRYNPVSDPDPRAPDAISNNGRDFLTLGSSTPGATPAVGSPGSWAVYPLHLPVRITQAEVVDPGPLPSGRPGLTLITPDPCYVQGPFNTTPSGSGELPPCALFADSLTVLSSRWKDADNDQDDDYDNPLPIAADTYLNLSLVLNNLPTDEGNVVAGGSGGVHNLVRYLEDWNGRTVRIRGSVVVLNRMRYGAAPLGESISQRAPRRLLDPQPGLFGDAHAPFAPVGIKVTRMVTTLADVR